MVFDFSFSNNDTGEDCTAELSSELFSHARITLTSEGPGKFNDTLFFVRISSYRQGSTDETCTQYSSSGGDGRTYHHDEDCLPSEDVQTTSLSSSSAVGDMTTILLRAPNSYWQDLTWRVCVGHKGAHHHARTMAHDDDMDASSVDFTLFAAGRVELLTSPSDNMSSRISTQSPELVLTRRLNDVVVGENHRIQLKYDVSSSSASKGGGFPAFVHSQATAPAACADASSYANGYCDSANNLAACNYDGGDCCFEDCANSTTCFQDLSSYPKACHKDETISVNFLQDQLLNSSLSCAPHYANATSGGASCSIRTAVRFCDEYVVGEQRGCIIELPAGTVEVNSSDIALADNNRSITIRGHQSAASTIMKYTGVVGLPSRFLHISFAADHSSTTEVVLEHMTITNFAMAGDWGGAVYCKYLKSGSFTDLHFYNNSALYGGGMYVNGVDNLLFSDLVFEDNAATVEGGGMYMFDTSFSHLDKCEFTSNVAGASAGGLYLSHVSHAVIGRSNFTHNDAAAAGGALYCGTTTNISLTECSFLSNDVSASGGGIYFQGVDDFAVHDTVFEDNTAGFNGGVFYIAESSNIVVSGSEFANNMGTFGGAVYVTTSENLTFQYTAFTANNAVVEGGK